MSTEPPADGSPPEIQMSGAAPFSDTKTDPGTHKRRPYAFTNPMYLPPQKAGKPFKMTIIVPESDRNEHRIYVGFEDLRATIKGVGVYFNGETATAKCEVVCKRPRIWPWQDERPPQATITITPAEDGAGCLILKSPYDDFLAATVETKMSEGPASHQSLETAGSGAYPNRKRLYKRPWVWLVAVLILFGGSTLLWQWHASNSNAEPSEEIAQVAEPEVIAEVTPPPAAEAEPEVTPPPSEPTEEADAEASTEAEPTDTAEPVVEDEPEDEPPTAPPALSSSDCKPHDPTGMSWYTYSGQTATKGQLIVSCPNGLYTTTGYTRDPKNVKVYEGLKPYTP